MKISKRVFWFVTLFTGFLSLNAVVGYSQQIEEPDQDTLGIAAIADEISEDVMPEVENIGENPPISSELLKERFSKLEKTIPLTYHTASHEFVEYFIYKRGNFTRSMMEKKALFFPLFEKVLAQNDLPTELKYLSMIESGLNPRIISRAKAGGLWQFMPATGREFGLVQDGYIDERFDPVKSTEAACKYLKQLYRIFGDWEMALASYNTGPGNVKRAMRRSGGNTFWTIYNALPRETRSYVPQYVAMNYMMNFGNDHGIFPENPEFLIPSDTIHVNGYLNLVTLCEQSGIDMLLLNKLNPQITKTILPEHTRNFVLKVPSMMYTYLQNNRLAIMDSCTKKYSSGNVMLAVSGDDGDIISTKESVDANGNTIKTYVKLRTAKSTHTVRSGESLSTISRKYRVDIADLKRWNHLSKSLIRRGQRLVIHKQVKEVVRVKEKPVVAKVETAPAANPQGSSQEQLAKAKEIVEEVGETEVASTKTKVVQKKSIYLVKKGETLGSISSKNNVSVADLKRWNSIKKNLIYKGQRLVIYKDVIVAAEVRKEVASAKTKNVEATSKSANLSAKYHTVQRGDTLWTISQRYGLELDHLKKANNIRGNAIKPGQKLLISG